MDEIEQEDLDDAPSAMAELKVGEGVPTNFEAQDDDEDLLVIDAIEDDEDGGEEAASKPVSSSDDAPRVLKPWPLPPSLTPKKRGRAGAFGEVAFDLEARPGVDGVWHCTACDAAYVDRVGLFAHTRFCSETVRHFANSAARQPSAPAHARRFSRRFCKLVTAMLRRPP